MSKLLIKNKNNNFIITIATILMIVFPIFSRYSSIISYVTLPEFISFILLGYILIFDIKNIKINLNLLFFILIIFLRMLLFLIFNDGREIFQVMGTSLRLMYVYFLLMVLGDNYFDKKLAEKVMINVTIILSIYSIIQYVYAMKGVILTTYIPKLKIMQGMGEFRNVDDILREQMSYGLQFRPRSLLNEPAHFATYLLSGLTIVLFTDEKLSFRKKIIAVLFTVTCLLSRSSTAIIMLFFIWFVYILKRIKTVSDAKRILSIIAIFAVFLFIYSIFNDFDILNYFLVRTFGKSKSLAGIANSTRFVQLKMGFEDFDRFIDIFIGKSTVANSGYLPGFFRLIYYFGFIGFLSYTLYIIEPSSDDSNLSRVMKLVFIIMNIGTEIIFGNFIFLYLPFIFCGKSSNEK